MSLAQLMTISCFLAGIVMVVYVGAILFVMRYGQQFLTNLVNRFLDPDKSRKNDNNEVRTSGSGRQAQPQVASSQALRRRAQEMDFPAPAASGFTSQTAPQADYSQTGYQQAARPSLRSRDQYPAFNPQAQANPQTQSFQPSMPTLSASRPFSASPLNPQQANYGQPAYPQQANPSVQQGYTQASANPLGQYPQQAPVNPLGQAAPRPQGNFQQSNPAPQYPQQTQPSQSVNYGQQGYPQQAPVNPLGQPAPRPLQQNLPPPPVPPVGQFGQQSAPPNPQSGNLGDYRPPLQSLSRPDNNQVTQRTQQRPLRRDSRKGDDFDIDGMIDSAGDLLDGF